MTIDPGVNSPRPVWQDLYHAALFETDRAKAPRRISEAERAVRTRMAELSSASGDHIEEDLILDDALYALRALRNSMSETQAA
jgi:hypothetical protein